jgi:2-hydroxy-6-oxonona-2,4-dienedioate hydrolase
MGTTTCVISSSVAAASLAGAGLLTARAARRYRRDLAAAWWRVRTARGRVVETARGPVEVAARGEGAPVLVVHGIFGGCDAGLASVRDACGPGYRLLAPSRFGYLGTPRPAVPRRPPRPTPTPPCSTGWGWGGSR